MDIQTILELVKSKIGIKSEARDTYISAIVEGVLKELEDVYGFTFDEDNAFHVLFVVDYAEYRYSNPKDGMPRDLQFRLHNLMIHGTGAV